MAQVPTTEQTVLPERAPLVFADPGSFGAQVGAAEQHLAASLGQAGDQFADQALRTQGLINAANVKQADMKFQDALGDLETDYYSKTGKDAIDAYPQFKQQMMSLRQQYLGQMTNPVAQGMLDSTLSYSAGRAIRSASMYAGTQAKKYVLDTSDARVQNLIQQAAGHPLDDQWFGAAEQSIRSEVAQQGQLMGWSPDQVQAQQNKYTSDIWQTRIGIVANSDINAAIDMFQKNADKIDPAHQASIQYALDNRAYTQMMRQTTLQNRIDADAKRQLDALQNATAANAVAETLAGRPPSDAQLSDWLRTGQIDRSGFDWIVSAGHQGATKDDLATYDEMTKALHAGTLSGADVMDAAGAGKLTSTTARSLIKAIEDPAAGKDAVATANHTALIEAIGGGMETSFVFGADTQRQLMNLRAQAQQEWTERVLVNHEDSTKVLQDMLPRYIQTSSIPPGVPQPMFGPVTDQQTLSIAAQRLKAAHDSGAIDQETFNKNALIIGQYQAFINFRAQQEAIAKSVRQQGKPAAQPSAPGQPMVPDTAGGQ